MNDLERLKKLENTIKGSIQKIDTNKQLNKNPAILLYTYGEARDFSVYDFKRKTFHDKI